MAYHRESTVPAGAIKVRKSVRYVLVPVPSEFVLDVMRWVLFRAPEESEAPGGDEARVLQLLDALDEDQKAVLYLVAKSVAEDDNLRVQDAAQELGQRPPAVSEAVRAINQRALWTSEIVSVRTETGVGVNGQTAKISYITMRPEIARPCTPPRDQRPCRTSDPDE